MNPNHSDELNVLFHVFEKEIQNNFDSFDSNIYDNITHSTVSDNSPINSLGLDYQQPPESHVESQPHITSHPFDPYVNPKKRNIDDDQLYFYNQYPDESPQPSYYQAIYKQQQAYPMVYHSSYQGKDPYSTKEPEQQLEQQPEPDYSYSSPKINQFSSFEQPISTLNPYPDNTDNENNYSNPELYHQSLSEQHSFDDETNLQTQFHEWKIMQTRLNTYNIIVDVFNMDNMSELYDVYHRFFAKDCLINLAKPGFAPVQAYTPNAAFALFYFSHEVYPDGLTKIIERRINNQHTLQHPLKSKASTMTIDYIYKFFGTRITNYTILDIYEEFVTDKTYQTFEMASYDGIVSLLVQCLGSQKYQMPSSISEINIPTSFICCASLTFDIQTNLVIQFDVEILSYNPPHKPKELPDQLNIPHVDS